MKIEAEVVETQNNGVMAKYFLKLSVGTKINKIRKCEEEIQAGLKAYAKPIIKVVPGRGLVSIELPIGKQKEVYFKDITYSDETELPLVLGKTYDGNNLIYDLIKCPHLLIAGTTGSGKTIMLHSIICGLIASNKNVKFMMIDPKMIELSYYNGIKQLLRPVITEMDDEDEKHPALSILDLLIEEMENRFSNFLDASVNSIIDYNKKYDEELPYIVLIIDEFSSLMGQNIKKEFQEKLCILAQKSRSCGIHIIIATQRPSVDVITGIIKANFPARISCRVVSQTDSRVILDQNGAEKLTGIGDALLNCGTFDMLRFRGAYISIDEIQKVCYSNRDKSNIFKRLWRLF